MAARVSRALARARIAQVGWAAKSMAERVSVVEKFATLLGERTQDCAVRLTRDTGKPVGQARDELTATVSRVRYFAAHAPGALADVTARCVEDVEEVIVREPLGVVANISAWNFPYFVGSNVWAPALLAGNAVLYKPSEHAVGTARAVAALWHDAGLPEGVFETLDASAAVGRALLDADDLDGVFFTGSYETGAAIAVKVAPTMMRTQLELGGKDAAFVCEDVADVAAVAADLADGAVYNAGQSCCSVERIYVHDAVYDAFVAALVETVRGFKSGSEWDEDTYLGPLCLTDAPAFLRAQLADALHKGATQLTGHEPAETPRHFAPTVLVDVDHSMEVMTVESFGPIVGVMRVTDDRHALRLVNDSRYGLTSAIYTSSRDRALEYLKQTKTGTAYWNCCDRVSPYLPWSGKKHSGVGVTCSELGIHAFTHARGYHLKQP